MRIFYKTREVQYLLLEQGLPDTALGSVLLFSILVYVVTEPPEVQPGEGSS